MNRLFALGAVVTTTLIAAWCLTSETPNHTPVVLLKHPAMPKNEAASSASQAVTWSQVQEPGVTASVPTRASTTTQVAEAVPEQEVTPHLAPYTRTPQVEQFRKRKGQDHTAVLAPEERAAIIAALKEKIKQAAAGGHHHHGLWIASELDFTKIAAGDLGQEYVEKLLPLAQQSIMELAKAAEGQLGKGCVESAGNMVNQSIHTLQSALSEQLASWYQNAYLHDLQRRIWAALPSHNADPSATNTAYEDRVRHMGCG